MNNWSTAKQIGDDSPILKLRSVRGKLYVYKPDGLYIIDLNGHISGPS